MRNLIQNISRFFTSNSFFRPTQKQKNVKGFSEDDTNKMFENAQSKIYIMFKYIDCICMREWRVRVRESTCGLKQAALLDMPQRKKRRKLMNVANKQVFASFQILKIFSETNKIFQQERIKIERNSMRTFFSISYPFRFFLLLLSQITLQCVSIHRLMTF